MVATPFDQIKKLLIKEIPPEVVCYLPDKWEKIGDVLIIKLSDRLTKYKGKIGKIYAKTLHCKTVLRDIGGISGIYRRPTVDIIYGSKNTETVHIEYGAKFVVDVNEVYFSPRLSGERYRVAQLVRDGEQIIDMFAGVGPFSIIIARYANPMKIYAIDKNPKAFEYLRKNIELNSINNIEPICGDSRSIVGKLIREELIDKADRIIMNLPHAASEFLQDALASIKIGGVIHYHEIIDNRNIDTRINEILEEVKQHGFDSEVLSKQIIGTYSTSEVHVCLDIHIKTQDN